MNEYDSEPHVENDQTTSGHGIEEQQTTSGHGIEEQRSDESVKADTPVEAPDTKQHVQMNLQPLYQFLVSNKVDDEKLKNFIGRAAARIRMVKELITDTNEVLDYLETKSNVVIPDREKVIRTLVMVVLQTALGVEKPKDDDIHL